MANIRVDIDYTIINGTAITFRSPCDCSAITGLKVYFPNEMKNIVSQEFKFVDAHNEDITEISDLFAENAIVKVIIDADRRLAFVQNADTNAYLEGRFKEIEEKAGSHASQHAKDGTDPITPESIGCSPAVHTHIASDVGAGTFAGQVVANGSGQTPGSYVLRNSKLSTVEYTPTVNGEICWVCSE